jgi:hypothetical protein
LAKDDKMYVGVTRIKCGPFEGVLWAQVDGDEQFVRFYDSKPIDRQRFKIVGGDVFLDGKKCARIKP